MADICAGLQKLVWRDIQVPYKSRSARFQQGKVRHTIVDGAHQIVEGTGPENWVYSYVIPFSDGFRAEGPYGDLFRKTLLEFVRACRDKTPAKLTDPLHGIVRPECISWSDDLEASRRNGLDATVEFIESPEVGKAPEKEASLREIALADKQLVADIAVNPYAPEYPGEAEGDLFDSIEGFGDQIVDLGERGRATLDKYSGKLERIEAVADKLEDPESFKIRESARRLRGNVHKAAERANPLRLVSVATTITNYTVGSLAAEYNMSVPELMELNPELVRIPEVPMGTEVTVYR